MNALDQFRDAIMADGLTPPDHIEPGRFLKFPGHQKSASNKAAWCILFDDLRGGMFGDYSTGMEGTWQASNSNPYTTAERDSNRQRIKTMQAQREADESARLTGEAEKAAIRWRAAAAPGAHPYLVRKGIQPHGIRQDGAALLIPLRDTAGKLHSLQTITPDGGKRFKGRMRGCYFPLGVKPPKVCLVIAEGFATGASIHEATGLPVAVAFNAGNLGPVAAALHKAYPALVLVLAADDDHLTPGNPGIAAARQAALAVGGFVVVPQFPKGRPPKATDFNDLAALAGLGAVRACFAEIEEVTTC